MATDTLIDLRKEIEVKRKAMYLAAKKGLTHPQVISISQELDILLNVLNRAINKQ
ncbi:aspartyl-phosphate phosphatase Spo0E family protein [Metabacillus fastidiosus]|uniref:aspartyl-phosphate phosphatase Spo0E family protein n=1 Tax=Metabacillus fastidiosus TaxID=1458 RepID=UPI0009EF4FB1|nr:aspartyl-phosphate phosphatase Spo0E family protein [Metabacillus fastidiosus]